MRKILITGATSGIGLASVKKLSKENYELILGCRNVEKTKQLIKLLKNNNKQLVISSYPLDLSSLKSIRNFVEQIEKNHEFIDVLFNNAGLYMDYYKPTEEGFEMTVGVNYIGNYFLTKLLMNLLIKGSKPQIINICSKAALFGRYKENKDLFYQHTHGFKAYSASKLLQLMMTIYFSRKYPMVSCNAVHPGHVATNIWKGESLMMKVAGKFANKSAISPEVAATSGLHLIRVLNMREKSGKFFEKAGVEIKIKDTIKDVTKIEKLISLTEEVINHAMK